MTISLHSIRRCLEGVIPGVVATCGADGVPNVSYVSQIHYVDQDQVALSFQFFNKTRRNMLDNPQMTALVIDHVTTARYRLALLYARTETEGPLFQKMKAKLAGIASHTGMSDVFALRGADVCRVLHIEKLPGTEAAEPPPARGWLSALRELSERMVQQVDMAPLLEDCLAGLAASVGIRHSMMLMADNSRQTLYTVATHGYAESGVGSEIPFGAGVIGVAAQYREPIRIIHRAAEYSYGNAVRAGFALDSQLETAIPFPGLPDPLSQLAIPILNRGELLGVLYAECEQDVGFSYDDEDALVLLALHLGTAIAGLQQWPETETTLNPIEPPTNPPAGRPLRVRYFPYNHSVFLDDDYLIKGVAGAILWRLLNLHQQAQRREFTNRELRLDKQLGLPDIDDNLEARLILLQRRLAEKSPALAIVKTGRGKFCLEVNRPVQLVEQDVDER